MRIVQGEYAAIYRRGRGVAAARFGTQYPGPDAALFQIAAAGRDCGVAAVQVGSEYCAGAGKLDAESFGAVFKNELNCRAKTLTTFIHGAPLSVGARDFR